MWGGGGWGGGRTRGPWGAVRWPVCWEGSEGRPPHAAGRVTLGRYFLSNALSPSEKSSCWLQHLPPRLGADQGH